MNLTICFGLPTVCGALLESSKSPLRAFPFLSVNKTNIMMIPGEMKRKIVLASFFLGGKGKVLGGRCSHRKITLKDISKMDLL